MQLQSVAVETEVQTGEDHDTTTLSRDEGSHWWFYPERPLEPGGQFISPTGQFSPEPACPREERTADKARTEDKGQRTGERECHSEPTRPHTVGKRDYNVSCADEAPFCPVQKRPEYVKWYPVSLVSSGLRCAVM